MDAPRITGTRVELPLPGAQRSAFHALGALALVAGLVAALGSNHPMVVALTWVVAALLALVVVLRVGHAAVVLDPEHLVIRGPVRSTTFSKSVIAAAEVDAPLSSVSGPWY